MTQLTELTDTLEQIARAEQQAQTNIVKTSDVPPGEDVYAVSIHPPEGRMLVKRRKNKPFNKHYPTGDEIIKGEHESLSLLVLYEAVPEPTGEMVDYFKGRTEAHVRRVKECIEQYTDTLGGKLNFTYLTELRKRGIRHDLSKYKMPEFLPYVYLTWWYKSDKKYQYPDGVKNLINEATLHHIKNNDHHPEFYENIDDMPNQAIMEMVADWEAMSKELGGSTKKWVEDNVGKKWKFNNEQVALINKCTEALTNTP